MKRAVTSKSSQSILLTSGRIPASLELARALNRAGHRIVIAECFQTHLCRYSNSTAKSYRIAPPRQLQQFKADILRLVELEAIDLIMPTCEEAIHLASFANELPAHCQGYFDDFSKLLRLHSKWDFIQYARDLGLQVPETSLLDSNSPQVPQDFQRHGFVLKREYSRGGTDVMIFPPELAADTSRLPTLTESDRWIVQKFLPGKTLCAFAICWHGKVLSTLTYEPALKLGQIGICFIRREKRIIDQWVRDFVAKTNYHGFLSFDFVEDEREVPWVIECNPRITSGIHLADHHVLAAAAEGPETFFQHAITYRPKQRAMLGTGILTVLPKLFTQPAMIKSLLQSVWKTRDVVFDWRDPVPSLHQFICLIQYIRISLTQRIPLASCPTYQLEWLETHTSLVKESECVSPAIHQKR